MGNCLSYQLVFPLQNPSRPQSLNSVMNALFASRLNLFGKNFTLTMEFNHPIWFAPSVVSNYSCTHPNQNAFSLCQIYTVSLSFCYRCFSCNEVKELVTSSTHWLIKCHQNMAHFGRKQLDRTKDGTTAPFEISPNVIPFVPISILFSFIINFCVGLLIEVLPLPL